MKKEYMRSASRVKCARCRVRVRVRVRVRARVRVRVRVREEWALGRILTLPPTPTPNLQGPLLLLLVGDALEGGGHHGDE